jgi:hypothetical protein
MFSRGTDKMTQFSCIQTTAAAASDNVHDQGAFFNLLFCSAKIVSDPRKHTNAKVSHLRRFSSTSLSASVLLDRLSTCVCEPDVPAAAAADELDELDATT